MRVSLRRIERREHPAAGAVRAATRGMVSLELVDELGRSGFGEAAPLEGFGHDSAEHALTVLGEVVGPGLEVPLGQTPEAATSSLLRAVGSLAGASPSACFALEAALLHLASARLGAPVASLLAPLAGNDAPSSVEVSALARSSEPVGSAVERELARGARVVKAKLGAKVPSDAELEALARVLAAHPGARVRFDANGAWTLAEASEALCRLARALPELVEQPVAPGSLAALGAQAVPWAADESLAWPDEVPALVGSPACAAFVLKPALLGVGRSLELARAAREAGKRVVVTHAFDGPVGLLAARAVAQAVHAVASGLEAHEGLGASPLQASSVPSGWHLAPSSEVGWGELSWRS
jgi:L-alanine-DL-glutamate epimerase-like enolase superfamily enzyme